MKIKSTIRKIGNSYYLLIPPEMMEHCKFTEGEDKTVIEDREKEFGPYMQAWALETDKEAKKK